MIELPIKQKVYQALQSLPFSFDREFEDFPDKKKPIWKTIRRFLEKQIDYVFDEEIQTSANKILEQIDGVLQTKEAQKIQSKAKENFLRFPNILAHIIAEYNQLENQEESKFDEPQFKESLLENLLFKELQYWTLTELNDSVDKKRAKLEQKKILSQLEKQQRNICKEFQRFCEDNEFNIRLVDEMITERISLKSYDSSSLDSTVISSISSTKSYDLRSFQSVNDPINHQIDQTGRSILESMSQGESSTREREIKQDEENKPQNSILSFLKKQNVGELKPQKESVTQSTQSTQSSQSSQSIYSSQSSPYSPLKGREQEEIKDPLNFAPLNGQRGEILEVRPQPVRPFVQIKEQQRPNVPQDRTSLNTNRMQESEQLTSVDFGQSILIEEENRNLYERCSQAMIDRYSTQSRFTEGQYKQSRELEVNNIMINQYRPLIDFLKKLPLKDVIQSSSSNGLVDGVEVYGSFDNKCGFRKLSDFNINIRVKGISDFNLGKCLFRLRDRLDFYRQKGYLKDLNLRSVIYSKDHSEVILSHNNNSFQPKIKDENTINFIYLTLNKKEHVESSRFIKQVVYNREEKCKDIAHLMNFLHLIFKRNKILDHKDIYHVWWTKNHYEAQQKSISQSRYVSMSVYALHMMVLYYLQQTGQIGRIKYSKQKKRYDFELIDTHITLFERFVKFLQFYSENGDYNSLHLHSTYIDVVERPAAQQTQVINEMNKQSHKISSKANGFMFAFVHPLIGEFSEADNGSMKNSYLHFQVQKGTEQEKLFSKKIKDLLERTKNIKPNTLWEPNNLFERTYEE